MQLLLRHAWRGIRMHVGKTNKISYVNPMMKNYWHALDQQKCVYLLLILKRGHVHSFMLTLEGLVFVDCHATNQKHLVVEGILIAYTKKNSLQS